MLVGLVVRSLDLVFNGGVGGSSRSMNQARRFQEPQELDEVSGAVGYLAEDVIDQGAGADGVEQPLREKNACPAKL